ncbi:hypothetical protein CPAV1605_1165 [seawater metagenome]|uniref:Uncharacterized protein n=1 Tax=seawater metagenome TaxID=1561972 RepID=A0A5E8CKW9_9ZZZZ
MYQDIDEDEFFEKRLPNFYQKYSDCINNNMMNNNVVEFIEECKFIFGYLEFSFTEVTEEDMKGAEEAKIKEFNDFGKNLKIILQTLNSINFDDVEDKYQHLNDRMVGISENMDVIKNFFAEMAKETKELNNFMKESNESMEKSFLDLQRNIYLSNFIKELNGITTFTLLDSNIKKEELISKMKEFKYMADPDILVAPNHPYPELDLNLEKFKNNKDISHALFKYNLDNVIYILNKQIQRTSGGLEFQNIDVTVT